MNIIFRNHLHYLDSITSKNDCPASSLELMGKPLIVRNIKILEEFFKIDTIMLPSEFSSTSDLIQENFPSINLKEFSDETKNVPADPSRSTGGVTKDDNSPIKTRKTTPQAEGPTGVKNESSFSDGNSIIKNIALNRSDGFFEIPLNAVLWCSQAADNLLIDSIVYPWDFLEIAQKVMYEEVKCTVISPNATVAKSCVVEGPCVIEDNVTIDDFCKIKGPTYIGNHSFIGMTSLIRNCMFGDNTRIGFNCEIGKSYFVGHDKIAHQNVILDSLIGKNVWFGGYSGTANVLLTRKNIRYDKGDGDLIDTNLDHFGAVVGNNCAIGASVIILPGRHINPNTTIQAGTIVGKKEE
jgi:UDP-N-acetylglucosamine diphosphorylase / glucose-1-phosphate thymidylyltransferase / UDP-N-acetylgalactosamine diphosphorylase / glucosamine-1-phosphate N-acetyltransferase / galactosamine-1-phosphate N-acetyltransferase